MSDADAKSGAHRKGVGAEERIGTVVDKLTIVRMLGRGGMGAVYEARHAKLARRFAIKFLLPEFAANRDVLRRFENEAKAAGGLEHPNLAAVMDVGQASDGAPYLVMEFLQGEDGAKLLRAHGHLPVRRATDIVAQACRGLAVAHRAGIVHRDLKPENLFITDAGDGRDLVKVLDFGIAKLRTVDASVATGTGATFGTAFYMSPEQARGAGEVDHRSDVWSMGVLLYELLSGQKPFQGGAFLEVIHKILSSEPTPLAELRPDLPPPLVALVHQAMRKEILERIPSVVAFGEALAPFASGGPGVAAPSGLAATAPSAPTMATPATLPPRAPSVAPTAPAPATTSGPGPRRGALIAGAVVVVVAGVLALGFGVLRRPAPTAVAPPPVVNAERAPAPAPALPPPAATAPPAAPPPEPAAAPVRAPAAVPGAAPSGQRERRSNVRTRIVVVGGEQPERAAAPTPPPPPPPKAAPIAEPRRTGQPIDIEKDNPYGN